MTQNRYSFREDFKAFDGKGVPPGLLLEINSVYTHDHVRVDKGVFYITCAGAKFICRTPDLKDLRADLSVCFHHCEGRRGFCVLFGYDMDRRKGFALDFSFVDGKADVSLRRVDRSDRETLSRADYACDMPRGDILVCIAVSQGAVSGEICGIGFAFDLPEGYDGGKAGVELTSSVGELAVNRIAVESGDEMTVEVIAEEKTAELSLLCGGTMPYTLSYSLKRISGVPYLDYRFDGGEQYRDRYPGYPRHTGQYSVECHKFTDPYIALYDPASMKRICGIPLYSGTFMTADPGLVWNVLLEYFNVIKLPLSGSFALPDDFGRTGAYIAFGCGKQYAKGYGMQRASDIEEVFDFDTARPVKTGKKEGAEYIGVTSDSEKTIDLIPDGVYDRGAVVSHLKKNHFFCESEDIVFSAGFVTRKSFISMSAYLCDAFGDRIGVFASERTGGGWRFIHEPLPVGVYRAGFEVFYGDTLYQTREITFEVYDPSGERCAPIESGLPFLFSMPNEQKYLDRDAFDLYNPAPDCDMEHYYSASGMPGDIGMKKRIWETNSIFGRKWYVWDSWHRTLTKEEFAEHGEELIRRSDYCYYPVPYEWAVMRHDPLNTVAFAEGWDNAAGLYGSGIMGYLRDFLALHPEIDIGVTPDSRSLTQDQLDRLLSSHIREWLDYANKRINEDFRKNTEWMRSINPDVKRACYGPFNLYAGPVFTHHGCRYVGFEPEGSLAEYMFDGFAQLEDYPYSCAYHTYQGAFFVSNALLHNPGLHIYPEEYTASEGGCIDGAVKDAHPPLGRYDMQPYFNVTHSYEYVYNTAYLTEDGFGYWRDRGFMQRDFTAEFVDVFVRGWKNVLKHEPDRPLRSIAYLSEIPNGEDRWNKELSCVSNQSNSGVSYVYETARLSGLPNGFTVSYGSLPTLTPEMTDCLVITSMSYAPAPVIAKIRELYASGVSLIAVGDVAGLEDIFGVSDDSWTGMICRLTDPDGSHERIFPNEAEFRYRPEEAETLLSASGDDGEHPVLLKKDRALLINADIDKLGCQTYGVRAPNYYAANISRLLRESLAGAMSVVTQPVAVSDSCGITLLKDRNGETLLLAVDYSDYDLADKDRTWESNITFNIGGITGAEAVYGEKPIVLSDGEEVRGISVRLHQQECALIALKGI